MKPCPFCAEMIQEAAIKCRFCGSMVDGGSSSPGPGEAKGTLGQGGAAKPAGAAPVPTLPLVIFSGAPSWKAWFFSYVGAVVLAPLAVGLAWWIASAVVEGSAWDEAPGWAIAASFLVPVAVAAGWIGALHLRRRSSHYRITDRTVDYEKGLFSKRVETLQLWRVQDIEFHQSLLERLLGIATIVLVTKDRGDPRLDLKGLPASREIFERLKDAAELARQQRVIGLTE